jgi:hypothetical protein
MKYFRKHLGIFLLKRQSCLVTQRSPRGRSGSLGSSVGQPDLRRNCTQFTFVIGTPNMLRIQAVIILTICNFACFMLHNYIKMNKLISPCKE